MHRFVFCKEPVFVLFTNVVQVETVRVIHLLVNIIPSMLDVTKGHYGADKLRVGMTMTIVRPITNDDVECIAHIATSV